MIDLNKLRQVVESGVDVNGKKIESIVGETRPKGENLKKYLDFKNATKEVRDKIIAGLDMGELGMTPEKWEKQLRQLAVLRGELEADNLESI